MISGDLKNGAQIASTFTPMDPFLITAASGMKTRLESLDMLANNVANASTAGFKADREFYTLYEQELPQIESHWTDYSQGALTVTGNPLDIALAGPGFIAANGAEGTVYTRDGGLHLTKAGELATRGGYTVRNAADPKGGAIKVDPAQSVDIDQAGTVRQSGQQIGQIEIASVATLPKALGKLGSSYFALTGSASAAVQKDPQVEQGKLEESNVPVTESAVRLITVLRQFEMLQKAVSVDSDMNRKAMDEVARVSS